MTNDENISRYTSNELKQMVERGEDRSDWEHIRSLSDEELEASIDREDEGYPDWSSVRVGGPSKKKQITVRLDPDLIEWFKGQGPGYQTRMNAVLRSYMMAKAK